MLNERVLVPSSRGAQVCMDVYVPRVSREIDPEIKRPAIVICPGGGYAFCSEREAEPVALSTACPAVSLYTGYCKISLPSLSTE